MREWDEGWVESGGWSLLPLDSPSFSPFPLPPPPSFLLYFLLYPDMVMILMIIVGLMVLVIREAVITFKEVIIIDVPNGDDGD